MKYYAIRVFLVSITSLQNIEFFGFLSQCFTYSSCISRHRLFKKLYVLSGKYLNLIPISSTLTSCYLWWSFWFPDQFDFLCYEAFLIFYLNLKRMSSLSLQPQIWVSLVKPVCYDCMGFLFLICVPLFFPQLKGFKNYLQSE